MIHILSIHSEFVKNYLRSILISRAWLWLQVNSLNEVSLEGDITVPGAPEAEDDDQEFNTLDEPVKDTIVRPQLTIYEMLLSMTATNRLWRQ